jgi:hypothetical protein
VLAVNDLDPLPRDERDQEVAEQDAQPLVLEIVADERDRWCGRAELDDADAVVRGRVGAVVRSGTGLDDQDLMVSVA